MSTTPATLALALVSAPSEGLKAAFDAKDHRDRFLRIAALTAEDVASLQVRLTVKVGEKPTTAVSASQPLRQCRSLLTLLPQFPIPVTRQEFIRYARGELPMWKTYTTRASIPEEQREQLNVLADNLSVIGRLVGAQTICELWYQVAAEVYAIVVQEHHSGDPVSQLVAVTDVFVKVTNMFSIVVLPGLC